MSLPDRGWKGYGAPGHKYARTYGSLDLAAARLRRAAIEADDRGHSLREAAFSRWLSWGPNEASVDYLMRRAMRGGA